MKWMRFVTAGVILAVGSATADPEIHGFVEMAGGGRLEPDGGREVDLQEVRTQLQLSDYGDRGEFFVAADFVQDDVRGGGAELGIREAWLKFLWWGERLEVKAGRQALNWGTGDLVFANDLFAKDWNSFFIGRDDPYLKVPTDAVRMMVRRWPVGVDLVWTPRFTADVLPDPERLPADVPVPEGMVFGGVDAPGGDFADGEFALRLHRRLGAGTIALYGYRGFTKTPEEVSVAMETPVPIMSLRHPELRVYGASARGALMGGVYWVEGAYRDIPDTRNGSDAMLPGPRADVIVGYQRSFGESASWEVQYYGAVELKRDELRRAAVEQGLEKDVDHRHLLTLRLEKRTYYDAVRLSLFAFHAPEDGDGHVRPFVSYDLSDEIQLALGANVFYGDPGTLFGDLNEGDNVYGRLRYRF